MASLVTTLMITSVAYGGGGAIWEFEGYHRPGDIVESTTAVTWNYDATPGTPQEGPYLLYLAPMNVEIDSWPQPPEESLLVGIVEVREGPFTDDDRSSYGPNHAAARFEIPDVPTGRYQILHCNDPCTKTLGNIVGGWHLRVIEGPDGRPAGDIAAEVEDRAVTAPLLIAAEPSTQETAVVGSSTTTTTMAESTDVVESVRVSGRSQVSAGGPGVDHPGEATGEPPARFDSLWLLMVGVVAVLLVVHIVRTQSQSWRPVEKSGNAPASTDVLTDE